MCASVVLCGFGVCIVKVSVCCVWVGRAHWCVSVQVCAGAWCTLHCCADGVNWCVCVGVGIKCTLVCLL